jgi:hypothetical protein
MLMTLNPTPKRAPAAAPVPTTVLWLVIERAGNGYLVRDAAANETWLIAHEDWLDAAVGLLREVNERLGSAGDAYDERTVAVMVEPGAHWLHANPDACQHERVRNTSGGSAGVWACVCGVEFVPVARPRKIEVAA